MPYKTLYLGIDPPPGVFHYPVIRTERIDSKELAVALSLPFSHMIFTSKNGVRHWPGDLIGKTAIAIGEATAKETQMRGAHSIIAPDATQEGVAALLDTLDLQKEFLIYPRSKLARSFLSEYLISKKIPHYAFDLYDTLFQRPEPVPDLADFDEIVFTSPSTAHAFGLIFHSIPQRIVLTPIGPITKKALEEYFFIRV